MPTVSQKGQVTIPVEVRDALGIHPGDEVVFEETPAGYVVRKEPATGRFEKWHGAIQGDETAAERMEDLRGRPLDSTPAEHEGDSDAGTDGGA